MRAGRDGERALREAQRQLVLAHRVQDQGDVALNKYIILYTTDSGMVFFFFQLETPAGFAII